jgi:hypothetical protein
MRRRAVAIGLVLGVLIGVGSTLVGIAAASGAAPRTSASAAERAPARLFVNAKEWSLILSRGSLATGSARIQLYNAGEDAHDLRLRRRGGTRSLRVAETQPGDLAEIRATLRRGTWKLWCSLPGHEKSGMRALLRVR